MPLCPPRVRSTPSLRMQYKSIDKENKDSNTKNTKVNAKNNLTTSTSIILLVYISHRSQSYSYWTMSEGGREVISHYRHQSESCYYMFVIHKNVCHVYSTHDNINIIKNAEITYPLVASGSQYLEFIQRYATVQDYRAQHRYFSGCVLVHIMYT